MPCAFVALPMIEPSISDLLERMFGGDNDGRLLGLSIVPVRAARIQTSSTLS